MKKIIVPVDFSNLSSDALDFAIEFNTLVKGEILLLHVLELPNYSFNIAGEVAQSRPEDFYNGQVIKAAHDRLQQWADKVVEAGQKVAIRMKHGNPYQNISAEIVEEKAHWIVMGSTGASGLSEVFLGSNTERVIRHSDCPVITIKGQTQIADMKNIVFASDLSDEQNWVAYKAKDVQELFNLNMHIVKVKTPHNFLTEKAAMEQLTAFSKRNYFENSTLNTIEGDYPDEGIIAFAEQVNAGLVIIGTHGKTGLAHIFGGSRAEDLANHSKIPVMTFKLPFE